MMRAPRPGRPLSELPGLRALNKIFGRATILCLCLIVLTVCSITVVTAYRPDLANPAQIGTDPSNYFAAGQRLNAGHPLYQWQAGDRPIGYGKEPDPWTFPLLSPPAMAVFWRPLAALGEVSMYVWWALGAFLLFAFVVWLSLRLDRCQLAIVMALALSCGVTMWSGNVNAYLIPAAAAVWYAQRRGRSGIAGSVIAVSTLAKLMPGILVWWLILRRDWRAVASFLATLAAGVLVSVLGAGLDAHLAYPSVAREANTVALSSWSTVEWARVIGLPAAVASLTPYLCAGVCMLIAFLLRERPGLAFGVCIAGLVLGTPDLRFEGLAWLTVGLVPLATQPDPLVLGARRVRRQIGRRIGASASV